MSTPDPALLDTDVASVLYRARLFRRVVPAGLVGVVADRPLAISVITLGGQCGQSQMVSHQKLDQFGVARPKSNRCDGLAGDRRPAIRVMRAGPGQLADVVEEAGQQQDVGPINLS